MLTGFRKAVRRNWIRPRHIVSSEPQFRKPIAQQFRERVCLPLIGEAIYCPLACLSSVYLAKHGIFEIALKRRRESSDIVRRDQKPSLAMGDDFLWTTRARCYDGKAATHRL